MPDTPQGFAKGIEPPKPPSAPLPGAEKTGEEKPEASNGIPRQIKTSGAIVGILATVAGILFGIQQIIQSNRSFRLEMERARAESARTAASFELELQKQRTDSDKARATISEQQTLQLKSQADLARAEADKQATAAQLQRDTWAQAGKSEQRAQLQQLQQYTANLVTDSKSDEKTIGYVAEIATFLSDDSTKPFALAALERRLGTYPDKQEVDAVFRALPDAGIEGLQLAIRENRRAWKQLRPTMEAVCAKKSPPTDDSEIGGLTCSELLRPVMAPLVSWTGPEAWLVQEQFSEQVGQFHVARGLPSGDDSISDSLIAILVDSRQAIERSIASVKPTDSLSLDGCFLPLFSPEGNTPADEITFRGAYVMGADLRQLRGRLLLFGINPDLSLFAARYTDLPIEELHLRLPPDAHLVQKATTRQ